MEIEKRAIKGYSYSFGVTCDNSAVSLLESGEQRYIKAINNKITNSQRDKKLIQKVGRYTKKQTNWEAKQIKQSCCRFYLNRTFGKMMISNWLAAIKANVLKMPMHYKNWDAVKEYEITIISLRPHACCLTSKALVMEPWNSPSL